MTDSDHILVIKLGALGDFIQTLGPMAAIRRHHPDAKITLLTTAPYKALGEACGYFDHVQCDIRPRWYDVPGWLSLRRALNKGQYRRVYDLQNNDRTSLYFRLFSPRPEWVGAAKGASHRNISPERTAGKAFAGHVQTLALGGIHDVAIDDLSWVKRDIGALSLPESYVVLVPGSAPGRPEKRWPAKEFGELARNLHAKGIVPIVIGTDAEADVAAKICSLCPDAMNLCGRTSLLDLVPLARGAIAAVGNDTGPMHIMAPTGCPCWVLFSRHSNPDRHAPIGRSVHIIKTDDLSYLKADHVFNEMSRIENDENSTYMSGQKI